MSDFWVSNQHEECHLRVPVVDCGLRILNNEATNEGIEGPHATHRFILYPTVVFS